MSRDRRTAVAVALCVLLLSVSTLAQNPVPFVNQPLVPTAVAPGGSGFTLTVNGTGFVSGSVVKWNGTALATTFVSSSQLTAVVPSSNVALARSASVTVQNSVAPLSNTAYFDITSKKSTLSFIGSELSDNGSPFSVSVGDFNGDGKLDLATANLESNNVGILLGNGDGTFQPTVYYAAGINPFSVAVGDFNGDGKLDLAVANSGSSNISILLGNGDGTFQPAVNYAQVSNAFFMAVGDFNGDGRLDLAVVDQPTNNVSILLGNGDGTFRIGATYTVGSGPSSIVAGDFNRDGKLDLAVANANDHNIEMLLGYGDGTFQTAGIFPVANQPIITAADFNGDGKLDLAVLERNINRLDVLLGNGDGTFTSLLVGPQVGVNPLVGSYSMDVGDLNGDGKLDLAIPDFQDNSVSVVMGNGDGTFQPPVSFGVAANAIVVAVGDFNGDGAPDLAVAQSSPTGPGPLSVLLQVGQQSLTTTTLASSVNPAVVGQTVTLTATVSSSGGTPAGTVTFSDGSTSIGSSVLTSGKGTLSASSLSVGSHSITASYAANSSFLGSSGSLTQQISYGVCPLYDQTRSVKSGAVFPIKLELCDVNSNDVSSSTIVVHATQVTAISGYSGPPETVGNSNPDFDFRFDSTQGPTGGYIFNLSTSGLASGTYSLQFTAGNDPVTHSVNFGVK